MILNPPRFIFLQEMEGIFWFVRVTEEWFTKWTIRIWPEADMASHHLITQLPVPVPIIKISSKSLVLKATKNMLLVQIGRLVTIVGLALRRDLMDKFEFLLCLVNDMKIKDLKYIFNKIAHYLKSRFHYVFITEQCTEGSWRSQCSYTQILKLRFEVFRFDVYLLKVYVKSERRFFFQISEYIDFNPKKYSWRQKMTFFSLMVHPSIKSDFSFGFPLKIYKIPFKCGNFTHCPDCQYGPKMVVNVGSRNFC